MSTIRVPKTQGLHSTTFKQPPLDGSLSLPALYDWQAVNSANHSLFVFEETNGSRRTIKWIEAVQAMQRATKLLHEAVGPSPETRDAENPPVVAVLASCDTITYFTFIVGALRSGYTLFPLSTRNSVAATKFLLEDTATSHLFVSSDQSMQDLAESALKDVSRGTMVKIHSMPTFEDLFQAECIDAGMGSLADIDMNKPAIILHSSGTTAFPKPIYITHRSLAESSSLPCFGDVDLADNVLSCHTLPMFHGMGMIAIFFTVASGVTIATFRPQTPPVVPNPTNAFEGVMKSKSDYVLISPAIIEMWSQDLQIVEALSSIKGIIYGGGPLTKESGDMFASKGGNVFVTYASTQTMIVSNFLPKPAGMDWEYFEVSPAREVHFTNIGDNGFELVVVASDFYRPSVINTQVNGRDAYATSDIVSPHPKKSGFWRIVGRTDDQIMHSTGEKTNPGPLEAMLMRDLHISGAIIFGRSRFHCGMLVQPKETFAFDPSDAEKLAEFRNLIWPAVESMNAFAPTHSRIFKEMILVTSPQKPFSYTAKGSIRRQAIIREYEAEIDMTYAAVEESSQDSIEAPSVWSLLSTTDFVKKVVQGTMKKRTSAYGDDADLFELGLDSLQATWIRNSILRALREKYSSIARDLPRTFVYDHPSILGLSRFISASVTGDTADAGLLARNVASKRCELHDLVDKYTKDVPSFAITRGRKDNSQIVVLLTGGTGSLGSNILAKLIQKDSVTLIYAMSRPSESGYSSKEKHTEAFQRENIDTKLLDRGKVRFLDGNAEQEDLGIDRKLYEEIRSSVSHIIHNAWRVNFNVAVRSFQLNIRSVRNFVHFALESPFSRPSRILFISSVGVFQGRHEIGLAPEEHLPQPDSALDTGYAESKWISEQILSRASQQTPLSATVIRCGQLTGGSSGAWNDHEWFPSLIKSSVALRKLPDMEGTVSWVTAYDAAGAIIDMFDAQSEVMHIVHPRPTSWSSIITEFANILKLPIVPYCDWISALEVEHTALESASADTIEVENAFQRIPALRLMDFFRSGQKQTDGPYVEPFGVPRMDNKKAMEASKTLKNADLIGPGHVECWVSYWRKSGFIP